MHVYNYMLGGEERMIDWMKYAEIQRLKRKGFRKSNVAKILELNRETVAKYWDMSPDSYEKSKEKHRARNPDV